MNNHIPSQAGYALLIVIVVVTALLILAAGTIRLTRSELYSATRDVARQRSLYIAEAGVQSALAQLQVDKATAHTDLSYTWSASSVAYADGQYDVSVLQDPSFPTDARRKRIESTGRFADQEVEIRAHAVVQDQNDVENPGDPGDCPILFSETGTARLVSTVTAGTAIFNGEIFSNEDAQIDVAAGIAFDANGAVRVGDDFYSNNLLGIGLGNDVTLNAILERGDAYQTLEPLAHNLGHVLCPLGVCVGVHFSNGMHGTQVAVPARQLPIVDWDTLREKPGVVVVNEDSQPFGTWDVASDTWVHGSTRNVGANTDVTYYVEGNVDFSDLRLAHRSRASIVARGWITLQELNIVAIGGIIDGDSDTQRLSLIAEDDVYVGRQVLSRLPLTVESETLALANFTGLGIDAVEVGDRNEVFVYSENGNAWVKSALISVNSNLRACVLAKGDATLGYTAQAFNEGIAPLGT